MEPSDKELRKLYANVDSTSTSLARRVPFYYAGYVALFLINILSIFISIWAYRANKEPSNSADNPQ